MFGWSKWDWVVFYLLVAGSTVLTCEVYKIMQEDRELEERNEKLQAAHVATPDEIAEGMMG